MLAFEKWSTYDDSEFCMGLKNIHIHTYMFYLPFSFFLSLLFLFVDVRRRRHVLRRRTRTFEKIFRVTCTAARVRIEGFTGIVQEQKGRHSRRDADQLSDTEQTITCMSSHPLTC